MCVHLSQSPTRAQPLHRARSGEYTKRSALDIALRTRRQLGGAVGAPAHLDRMVNTLRDAVDLAQMGEALEEGEAEAEAEDKVEGEAEDEAESARSREGAAASEAGEEGMASAAGAGDAAGGESGRQSESAEGETGTDTARGGCGGGSRRFAACSLESVPWLPEIRLYGAGRGLGQGMSLLGRCIPATLPVVYTVHHKHACWLDELRDAPTAGRSTARAIWRARSRRRRAWRTC